MTKLSLKLGSPDPEDGFSYPNRSHIMSRTEYKEIDFFSFFFAREIDTISNLKKQNWSDIRYTITFIQNMKKSV